MAAGADSGPCLRCSGAIQRGSFRMDTIIHSQRHGKAVADVGCQICRVLLDSNHFDVACGVLARLDVYDFLNGRSTPYTDNLPTRRSDQSLRSVPTFERLSLQSSRVWARHRRAPGYVRLHVWTLSTFGNYRHNADAAIFIHRAHHAGVCCSVPRSPPPQSTAVFCHGAGENYK